LGKTKVNKDMVKSISDPEKHKLFPLFHNGITVITKELELTNEKIIVEDYYVVNGCQSISSLFNNKSALTDDLRVLTKFIQLDPASQEAQMITEYSNNQNGVRPRDFKSNHQIQIRLQSEFLKHYASDYVYEIKRGEALGPGEVISNEDAGLYLMAFDLKEPWATHRKYEIFEDKHSALFGRPEVTADRIVLCRVIMNEIEARLPKLENELVAKHVMTKFALLSVVRDYFADDGTFNAVLHEPRKYVRSKEIREKFAKVVGGFVDELVIDFNMESRDFPEDFDYRDKLRDQEWTKALSKSLAKEYFKQKARNKAKTFSQAWTDA
jgi:AIPR protein